MARLIKTRLRDFNEVLLQEEMMAALSVAVAVQLAGFEKNPGTNTYSPSAEPRLIDRHRGENPKPDVFADPGEVWIISRDDLSGANETLVDTLLSAHDEAGASIAQADRIQDGLDVTDLTTLYNLSTPTGLERDRMLELSSRLILRRFNQRI